MAETKRKAEEENPLATAMATWEGPNQQQQKRQRKTEDELKWEELKGSVLGNFTPSMAKWQCVQQWNSLWRNNWHNDIDVCAKALSCGLPVDCLKKECSNRFLKNAQDIVNFLQHHTKTISQAKELWDILDKKDQCNKLFAFAALDRGVPFTRIPTEITKDFTILKEGLEKGLFKWKALPKKLRRDVQFALSAMVSESRPALFEILEDVTNNKETLWLEWARKHPEEIAQTFPQLVFREPPPQSLLSNSEIMSSIISENHNVLKYVGSSLSEELLISTLEQHPLALGHMGAHTFRRFPKILLSFDNIQKYNAAVKLAMKNIILIDQFIWHLVLRVPNELWSDRKFVVETWLKAGSPLSPDMPERFYDDEEIILTHAKYFYELWGEQRFGDDTGDLCWGYGGISKRLQSDRKFLKKVMDLASMDATMSLIFWSPLDNDFELQILGCSKWECYRPYSRWTYLHSEDSLRRAKFYNTIRRKLRDYQGFCTGVLCGIKAESGSQLSRLDQGPDANIKKKIASFLDFPTGEFLTHLLRAAQNLNLSPDDNDEPEEDE